MNRRMALVSCQLFFLLALISIVHAADETFTDQFLGSPLLILAAIIIIDVIALIYHKIKK